MVGGAVSFASEGQRLSRTSRDSLRAVAVEDQTAASEEAHRMGISKGGRAADGKRMLTEHSSTNRGGNVPCYTRGRPSFLSRGQ